MNKSSTRKLSGTALVATKRKSMSLSEEGLVKVENLLPTTALPLLIQPAVTGLDLIDWSTNNREFIEAALYQYGGILFRNFGVKSIEEFEHFIRVTGGELFKYSERSSPRSEVSNKIYTSTDYPADYSIFLHNEHSYSRSFPLKIYFYCVTPAQQGGETPIADCRKVLQRINPEIKRQFSQKGWMYMRNFGNGFGLSWPTVFQTNDKSVVEKYCHDAGIMVEWKDEDHLRTRQVRPVAATHPRTGEQVWFNHATFFHVSTLEPTVRETLMAEFTQDDLPNNTFYGDGSPIEPMVLEHLRQAYLQEKVLFPWQEGDILMLDNMLTAHAREPFKGSRKILVGMADLHTREDS